MKEGYKTTEFWISLAGAAGGLALALGLVTPEQAAAGNEAVSIIAGAIVSVASIFGYNVSRGKAKGGDL